MCVTLVAEGGAQVAGMRAQDEIAMPHSRPSVSQKRPIPALVQCPKLERLCMTGRHKGDH